MSDDAVWSLPPVTIHQTLMAEQLSGELPWHITDYGIDKYLWPRVQGKTIIGVVDTGVSMNHPTLDGVILGAKDFTGSRYGSQDVNSHGSHCAGVIASRDFGVAKGHKLAIGKALGDEGTGSDAMIEGAIDYVCGEMKARVVSCSLGSTQRSSRISNCIQKWTQQGAIFIIAAGNDSGDVNWPARESFVGSVTAIDRQKNLAPFSSRGEAADICAPGVEIRSAGRGTSYVVMSGTSMACPWVAGYTAVWRDWRISIGKTATITDWLEWINKATIDLGEAGRDNKYGAGLLDPTKGFEDAATPIPAPPATMGRVRSVVVTMDDGTVQVLEKK